MSNINKDILEARLEYELLNTSDNVLTGITKRAIDVGIDSLSSKQKYHVLPLLTEQCNGVTNPGGFHNRCSKTLKDEELLQALNNYNYYESYLCESCINETEDYARRWEKIKNE